MQANNRLLAILALSLSLTACESLPTLPGLPGGGPQPAEVIKKTEPAQPSQQALQAARLRQRLDELAARPIPERQQGQLQLATWLIGQQRLQEAQHVLQRTFVFNLATALQQDKILLEARLALADKRPADALNLLQPMDTSDRQIQQRWFDLRAQALYAQSDWLASVRARIQRATYLEDRLDIRDNQQLIWQTLEQASKAELRAISAQEPELQGWAELQLIKRESGTYLGDDRRAVNDWLARHPDHPLERSLLSTWMAGPEAVLDSQRPLALLLPLSGQHARAAAAIRDGLLAAYYMDSEHATLPPVLIYDSTADPLKAYHQAVQDDAQLVIGPLRKAAVAQLAAQVKLETPVLALNQLKQTMPEEIAVFGGEISPTATQPATGVGTELPLRPLAAQPPRLPADLYQFGLSPEQEVRQIVERLVAEGYSRALALAPTGPWGDRMAQTLEQTWQQREGKLLHIQRYNPKSDDFSRPIKSLLNIDDSQRRRRRLDIVLGETTAFEPRRRKDVDSIIMIALPRQARLIRPQLRFHYAANLPVYATSHAFSGHLDRRADRDMNGLRFADSPWVLARSGRGRDPELLSMTDRRLRRQLSTAWPQSFKSLTRFYALGVDAYHLAPMLKTLRQRPETRYRGSTGTLRIDRQGRVHRQLTWANFVNGAPRPVATPEAVDRLPAETPQP